MLGIIIGIAAIIAIVSTIKGTNEQIKNNLIGSGNNTVRVKLSQGEDEYYYGWNPIPDGVPVVSDKVKAEIEKIDEVECCTVYRYRSYLDQLFYKSNQLESAAIYGIDDDFFYTAGYQIKFGKGFSPKDHEGKSKVCIIDDVVVASIFGSDDPIGKTLDIMKEPFTVVGVAVRSTTFEPVINSIEDYWMYNEQAGGTIFIPTEAWPMIYQYDEPQNVIAKAVNTDGMTTAGKATADILNRYLSVNSESNISYRSENLLEQAKSLQELSSSTNNMLIWIAGISLLVGGIGVMNIMLVSVTERTREIGLKKALGARRGKILMQFLTEAAVLTNTGGLIGVAAGIGLAQIVSRVAEVPVAISTPAIVISVVFSIVVGIVFGLIPSIKAARLNPIDALRYE